MDRVRVAMEVGTQSAWIAREFSKLGHEVIVTNSRELKWITASDAKNDKNDALKLARLARADRNLLHAVEHRTAEQQAELAVIRARDALVRSRTLLVNTAHGVVKGFGLRLPATITLTFGARALAGLPEHLHEAMRRLLEQIDGLSIAIRDYERRIETVAVQHSEVEKLVSIPGVGTLTALTFTLEAAEKLAFPNSTSRAQKFFAQKRARKHRRGVGGHFASLKFCRGYTNPSFSAASLACACHPM